METWKEAEEGEKIRRKCWADDVYSFPAWQARHKNEEFVEISWSMVESPAWNSLGKMLYGFILNAWSGRVTQRTERKK